MGNSLRPSQSPPAHHKARYWAPLLFLIYINDLPDSMRHSTTRLFADDCLMYRNIRSGRDTELLQQDMDQLQIWEKDWLMNVNASKCQTIHFSRKGNSITKMYTIHGEDLESVDNATYLKASNSTQQQHGAHTATVPPGNQSAPEHSCKGISLAPRGR